MDKMRCPRSVQPHTSAMVAVLFLLLLDNHFMIHLRKCLTPQRQDGYRMLWQLLVCLKETTSQDMATGGTVIISFVEAFLVAHYIFGDYFVTTDECWEILTTLAPEAMKWWNVRCTKWCECSVNNEIQQFSRIEYTARSLEIPGHARYLYKDTEREAAGRWQYEVGGESVEQCPQGVCDRVRYRYLTTTGDCTSHFRMRFHDGCDRELFENVTALKTIPFNGVHYAVWGGIWRFQSKRTDACYLVLNAVGDPKWVRWNTEKGRLTEENSLDPKMCVELLFVRPAISCWCGRYNDDTMHQCLRQNCKRSAHRRCIKKAWPNWQGKKWRGGKGNHCQQPGCEATFQAKSAGRKRRTGAQ